MAPLDRKCPADLLANLQEEITSLTYKKKRNKQVHVSLSQSGASGCESDRTFMSASTNNKPRQEAGYAARCMAVPESGAADSNRRQSRWQRVVARR